MRELLVGGEFRPCIVVGEVERLLVCVERVDHRGGQRADSIAGKAERSARPLPQVCGSLMVMAHAPHRFTTLRMLSSGSLNQATLMSPETCTSPSSLVSGKS